MIPPKVAVAGPSFYELYRAIADDKTLTAKQRAAAEVGLLKQWISNPRGMCLSLLDHPDYAILQTPLATFVTKFRDISEVLEHDDVFGVAPGYGERMAISTGAFMLGMDAGASYERETSLIRLAMPATDVPALRAWLRSYAEGIVGQIAKAGTRIDIAEDIGYRVPAGFCGYYYGVPGPGQDVWTAWQQMLAMYIFNFWTDGSPFKEEASAVGLRYQSYIDDTVRQRWAAVASGKDVPDDVLTRLITRAIADPAGSLDEVAIRRNLGGMSIGSTIAPSNNIIFALDTIIGLKDSDPGTFATILRAITDNDGQLLERCVLEACRIGNPVPPTLFRIAKQDYIVAAGTQRAKTVAAGTTVVLVPTAAVMDGESIDDPTRFRIDRPEWNYMIFGDGLHRCSGRAIGTIMLTEAVRAVLKLPNVRRTAGAAGHVQFGAGLPGMGYPAHLLFDFDSA